MKFIPYTPIGSVAPHLVSGAQADLRRGLGPKLRGRADLPPGPAALLAAHSAAIDAMVRAFREGLDLL